ncbi:MAG: hypothetical protein JNK40_05555 [Chromatiales bacterium]|nr:hypothetical protein [Chromatiales bacterium]
MASPTHRSGPTPATIALLCFLGPVLTVHASYAVSAAAGIVPACMPYLEGCTSISATGRHGLGYVLFKAGMLPSALLLIVYWRLCRDWLLGAGDRAGPGLRSLLWLGIAGALFMILYTVFLGHKGEVYNLLRRFGVSLNLGFTYLAQLLVVWRLRRLRDKGGRLPCPAWILRAKTWLVTVLLLLGLGSIPVSNFIADKDPVENAIEWAFCLLMSSFYLLTALAWRRRDQPP